MLALEHGGLSLESAIEVGTAKVGINHLLGLAETQLDVCKTNELRCLQNILGCLVLVAEKGIEFSQTDIALGAGRPVVFIPAMAHHIEEAVESVISNPDPLVSSTAAQMWESYAGQVISDPQYAVY